MKKIKPYFVKKDDRGLIKGISQHKIWREINYLESRKGTIRGRHYHKKTLEAFYIIAGKIKLTVFNVKNKKQNELVIKKGDIFIIELNELHTFETLEDSSWINMLSQSMADGKDFHLLKE